MSWVAIAVGGASLLAGADAADDAADAQTDASNAGIAEQRRQFDLARSDLAPYRQVGTQALNALGSIYGYNTAQPEAEQTVQPQGMTTQQFAANAVNSGGRPRNVLDQLLININAANPVSQGTPATQQTGTPQSGNALTAPDYSAFFASPDYNFRRDEGTRDIGNSFAARGGAASGNALRALAEFNSGLAAGEFSNYFNRQASLAGIGQTATNTGIGVGQNTGANVANLLGQAGDARASGVLGRNAALQGGLNDFYDIWQNRRPRTSNDLGRGGSWG